MSKSTKDKRIEELVEQLKQITLELQQLQSTNTDSDEDTEIVVGSTVSVTNNYKGEFGTTGKVTRVTKHQATLKTSTGKTLTRHKKNLKIINNKKK